MVYYPRVLVIGPGGQKGLLALGFLTALEDKDILKYVDTFCGVSVGAIISLLMVAGYEIRDIINNILSLDIFEGIDEFSLKGVINNRGLLSNDSIRGKLSKLVVDKFGMIPTLHGLYLKTGKSLNVVTYNTTDDICEHMNPFSNPNDSCLDVTMCSINIPIIFYEMNYNGKTYVDGAFGNPYPIDYFDDGIFNVLGIFMKSSHNTNKNMSDYLTKIVDSLLYQRVNGIIRASSDKCRHIILETDCSGFIGYNLTPFDKANMLITGHQKGVEYIQKYTLPILKNNEKYSYPEYYFLETFED